MSETSPGSLPSFIVPVRESWRRQGSGQRVLRGFLGVTFAYAGVQKFADPNFFRRGSADYIGSQITNFSHGSPIGGLLHAVAGMPIVTGIFIAFAELAIGLATLLGSAPLTAAIGGAFISLALFLSATWHVHPYFLGSDSIYAVAWIAYALGIVELRRRLRRSASSKPHRGAPATHGASMGRREMLRAGFVAAITMMAGGIATLVQGKARTIAAVSPAAPTTAPSAGPSLSPAQAVAAPSGTTIGNIKKIPVGSGIPFTDPTTGDPSAVLRLTSSEVVAFSRVCTHAGCRVDYDQQQRLLFCPCHGAEFDPAHGGRAVRGPAYQPLPSIKIHVDPATGDIVAD